jgi:hypothetical protein
VQLTLSLPELHSVYTPYTIHGARAGATASNAAHPAECYRAAALEELTYGSALSLTELYSLYTQCVYVYNVTLCTHFKGFNVALQVLPLPVVLLLHVTLCRGACWRVTWAVTAVTVTALTVTAAAVLGRLHIAPVQLHNSALELAAIV